MVGTFYVVEREPFAKSANEERNKRYLINISWYIYLALNITTVCETNTEVKPRFGSVTKVSGYGTLTVGTQIWGGGG
jgi:hypothetical protein